jgi:hypothetical protein
VKKKLEDNQASRELERKSWDTEKVKLQEEKEKFKSKLLSLSADKLKVYNEVVQLKKDLGNFDEALVLSFSLIFPAPLATLYSSLYLVL